MPHFLVLLLLPFAWLYAGVMAVRNWLYDKGLKSSFAFETPVISVGNLRVGGTGKTPHVAWLVAELRTHGAKLAILSRGYGRSTKGFRLADTAVTAATIGDEPLQHYQDFGGQIPVAVAEDRRAGLTLLLAARPDLTTVVLDDAYQHRRVRPALSILLTEQQRPFYTDYVLPAGRLRESRAGARRADAVIVTKCADMLSSAQREEITRQIRRYARPNVPVLFSTYAYGEPVALGSLKKPPGTDIVLLTGIARPEPLRAYLAAAGYRIGHHARYGDHHAFSAADVAAVAAQLQPGQCVFTTQKDAVRLLEPGLRTAVAQLPVFYIPITVQFLADDATRLRQLLSPYFQPQAVV
ncbi:lipid-A-disaccharide kinase [Hymenobacter roseosalivarius DSM 11622]|uniref:Tetraacyldisaccharide 4'-kinase n=1 Tax=Hymenobacter roseosalivarius DSM 11622 TaxID=645990 RepID=A0A1W1W069_9BACT|nr:tetraacyldisaccharide 4'-kinase [Hymenobacter roseosalivarius]SMB98976.1 lipid-A-disaccharide kinase [Hymenobacter roseosalivarius DSM 11622]